MIVEAGFWRDRGSAQLARAARQHRENRAGGWGDRILVGAGTVLEAERSRRHVAASRRLSLVVAPNADPAVIERAVTVGLAVLPGVATMTEAFQALRAGASGLKLFPGEAMPPEVVRAWRAGSAQGD